MPEYDVARVISIACVVLIHVIALYAAPGVGDSLALRFVRYLSREVRFAVPMFILLSGALSWTRAGSVAEWRAFLVRRFRVVLVPYLVWSAVFMVAGDFFGFTSLGTPIVIAKQLVTGAGWYHLYFVPIIMGVYILAPVASWLYRRSASGLLIAGTLAGLVIPFLLAHIGLRMTTVLTLISNVSLYLPYAAFGAWYAGARREGARPFERLWPLLIVAGIVVSTAGLLADLPVGPEPVSLVVALFSNLLVSFGVIGLAEAVTHRWSSIGERASALASSAFGVYLAHPLVILLLQVTGPFVTPGGSDVARIAFLALVWVLVTVGTFVAVRALSSVGWLWWLHGVPPRRREAVAPARPDAA